MGEGGGGLLGREQGAMNLQLNIYSREAILESQFQGWIQEGHGAPMLPEVLSYGLNFPGGACSQTPPECCVLYTSTDNLVLCAPHSICMPPHFFNLWIHPFV